MAVCHQQAVLANNSFVPVNRSTIYGHTFSDDGIVTNLSGCVFTLKL
jgi:hypothetical protein